MATATYTDEQLKGIGANAWTNPRTGTVRHYLNTALAWAGFDVRFYNTGNVCGADYRGEHVSNTKASAVTAVKVYVEGGKVVVQGVRALENAGIPIDDVVEAVAAKVAEWDATQAPAEEPIEDVAPITLTEPQRKALTRFAEAGERGTAWFGAVDRRLKTKGLIAYVGNHEPHSVHKITAKGRHALGLAVGGPVPAAAGTAEAGFALVQTDGDPAVESVPGFTIPTDVQPAKVITATYTRTQLLDLGAHARRNPDTGGTRYHLNSHLILTRAGFVTDFSRDAKVISASYKGEPVDNTSAQAVVRGVKIYADDGRITVEGVDVLDHAGIPVRDLHDTIAADVAWWRTSVEDERVLTVTTADEIRAQLAHFFEAGEGNFDLDAITADLVAAYDLTGNRPTETLNDIDTDTFHRIIARHDLDENPIPGAETATGPADPVPATEDTGDGVFEPAEDLSDSLRRRIAFTGWLTAHPEIPAPVRENHGHDVLTALWPYTGPDGLCALYRALGVDRDDTDAVFRTCGYLAIAGWIAGWHVLATVAFDEHTDDFSSRLSASDNMSRFLDIVATCHHRADDEG